MTTATITECSFDGCDRPKRANGLCTTHYQQKRRGKTLTPIRPSAVERHAVNRADVVFFEHTPLIVDVEQSGALTIVTTPEFEDKHRRFAEIWFDSDVDNELVHTYVNRFGQGRVMTIWHSRS